MGNGASIFPDQPDYRAGRASDPGTCWKRQHREKPHDAAEADGLPTALTMIPLFKRLLLKLLRCT
jgi:hypothetical protein